MACPLGDLLADDRVELMTSYSNVVADRVAASKKAKSFHLNWRRTQPRVQPFWTYRLEATLNRSRAECS